MNFVVTGATGFIGRHLLGKVVGQEIVGTLSLVYLVVARRSAGLTAGEAILRVRYP